MALEVPAVVKAADPAKASRLVPPESTPAISKGSAKSDRIVSRPLVSTSIKRAGALPAANDDRSSAVVIARRPRVVNRPRRRMSTSGGAMPPTRLGASWCGGARRNPDRPVVCDFFAHVRTRFVCAIYVEALHSVD